MPLPSPRNPIMPARGGYATLVANIGSLNEGEIVWADDQNQFYVKENGSLVSAADSVPGTLVLVAQKADFPTPVGGVITLAANVTYFITAVIDLTGDRLVAGANTVIIGGSSENCRLKSTGLTGTALISSAYSLPIRNIAIEADIALDLDATGNANQALDWFGVNFVDCGSVGLIKNYSNFIFSDGAFLNSAGLTFDGTIGTIGFLSSLFSASANNDIIILADTLVVTRRVRSAFSAFVANGATAAAFEVETGAIIPNEGLIFIECNFTLIAGSTGINGLGSVSTSNKILTKGCVGVANTAVNGQLYMTENATATIINSINTFVKIAGATTPSPDNAKYTHTNNRLTNDATRIRKFLIQATLSFTGSNGNQYEFGFYDSKLGGIRTPSRIHVTAGSGRIESVHTSCVVEHSQGDYIEMWVANRTASNNVTIEDMNMIITELG